MVTPLPPLKPLPAPVLTADNIYAPSAWTDFDGGWLWFGGWLRNWESHGGYDSVYLIRTHDPLFRHFREEPVLCQGLQGAPNTLGMMNDSSVRRITDGTWRALYSWVPPTWPANGKGQEESCVIAWSSSADGINWTPPQQVQFLNVVTRGGVPTAVTLPGPFARPSWLFDAGSDELILCCDGQVDGVEGTYQFLTREQEPASFNLLGRISPPGRTYYDVDHWIDASGTRHLLYRDPVADAAETGGRWSIRHSALGQSDPLPFPPGPIILGPNVGTWAQQTHNGCWVTDDDGNIAGVLFGGALVGGGAKIGMAVVNGS